MQYYNYLSTIKFDPDDIVILFTAVLFKRTTTQILTGIIEHVIDNNGDIRFVITEADFNHNKVISSQNLNQFYINILLFKEKI